MPSALSPAVQSMPAAKAKATVQRERNRRKREKEEQQMAGLRLAGELGATGGAALMGQFKANDIKAGGRVRLSAIVGAIGKAAVLAGPSSALGMGLARGAAVGLDLAAYQASADRQRPVGQGAQVALRALLRDDSGA